MVRFLSFFSCSLSLAGFTGFEVVALAQASSSPAFVTET